MRRDPLEPVFFNFGELGHPGWTPVTCFEMQLILSGAQSMIDNYDHESVDFMIEKSHNELLHKALNEGITEQWVSQALLLTALRGLRGDPVPEVLHWDQR